MDLLKRFFFYAIGLSFGAIIVYFFWKQKKVTFDYGMDARTLKTIRIKKRLFSDEAKQAMKLYNIDTLQITKLLNNADVDFSKSNQRKKPCAEYYLTGREEMENIHLYVIRCDSTATIDKIIKK